MMSFAKTRRDVLVGASALAVAVSGRRVSALEQSFSWEGLKAFAADLASKPYVPLPPPPAGVDKVTYDALNDLAFRPEAELWSGKAAVRFFPLCAGAAQPVRIFAVENGQAKEIRFSRSMFSGADNLPPAVDGFSGFRIMDPGGKSDWLAFRSASYFRSSGALDQYGLSARALAIDTGLSRPEEFPRFSHFWLERGDDDVVTVYALLQSPSAAGAWRFVNRHSAAGVTQEVSAALTLRGDIERLGLAPLTSMFWYGEGTTRCKAVDWRPEIHDSDGLAMLTGHGERIWRPLENPPVPHVCGFSDHTPKGFGLLQRDRNFDHYQDDGVFYDKRPNLWVEPGGDWQAGDVTLVELPTDRETMDNIVAFWAPAAPARKGSRYAFDYRLIWNAAEPQPAPGARVVDCWQGVAGAPGGKPLANALRLVSDFSGPSLAGLDATSGVEPVVSLTRGPPLSVHAYNVVGQPSRWRLMVDVPVDGTARTLRAFLRRGDSALTETLVRELFQPAPDRT